MRYTSFSDESYTTAERYRSICAFTFPTQCQNKIEQELSAILKESDVSEFKWNKLANAKYHFCANKIIDFIIKNLYIHNIRLDIIIWDTHDRRHNVPGRDDNANFCRMFFHLMKSSMKKRPKNVVWNIFPDERMGIDWQTVHDCLNSVGKWKEYMESPLWGDFFTDAYYSIDDFKQINSKNFPCCQAADLFSGISVFSKIEFNKYLSWLHKVNPNYSLFPTVYEELTNRESVRFKVMKYFDEICKINRLGVSLKTYKGFTTMEPKNPINFWNYSPQLDMDKAPTRGNY